MRVYNVVYPQLDEIDLARDAARLDVPVYMILGRYDVNAMASLAEEYFEKLEAPSKELIWFEHSGHPPLYSESRRFIELMARVKAETSAPVGTSFSRMSGGEPPAELRVCPAPTVAGKIR